MLSKEDKILGLVLILAGPILVVIALYLFS
jgi:hypothetical protein